MIDCPFFIDKESACGLISHLEPPVSGRGSKQGLVSASLEIGRKLAGLHGFSFAATGTCMYPCIKQGDILFVDPCAIGNAKVGDVAVIRRNGLLVGHRIISKGVDKEHGEWIVTRADRYAVSDGPTYQDGMLGVISCVERKGTVVSLDPVRLRGLELLEVFLWEWWHWKAKPGVARYLSFIQQMLLYRFFAARYLSARYPAPDFSVRVPLKPMQQTDLFQVFPASGLDLSLVQQRDAPVAQLMVQLEFQRKVPAAWVILIRRPVGCPDGGGWYVGRSWCRNRYRGAGLENRLIAEARNIIGRSGETIQGTR